MKIIKNIENHFLCAMIMNLLFFYTLCLGDFKQDKFIIASWVDPRMLGNPDPDPVSGDTKGDLERLREFVDANFNLLGGHGAGYYSHDINDIFPNVGNRYALYLVDRINTEYGEKTLQMLPVDLFDYYTYYSYISPYGIIDDYISLPDNLRNSIYGYLVKDEPFFDDLKNSQYPMFKEIQNKDPDKLSYVNAFGVSYQGANIDRREWKKHLEIMTNRQSSISWDLYCWWRTRTGEGDVGQRIFDCCKITSKVCKKNKTNWWKCVGSVEQFYTREDGTFDRGIKDLSKAELSFAAFLPVIYGAKGLVWFTYESPCSPKQNTADWCILPGKGRGYRNALIKADPTNISGCINDDTYNSVRDINFELKQMGPILMNLEWITTVHSHRENPFPSAWRLDLVDLNTPVINMIEPDLNMQIPVDDREKTVGIGIFQENDEQFVDLSGYEYFLLVLNKNKGVMSNKVGLHFKNWYRPFKYNKKEKAWKSISGVTEYIAIDLPGECSAELIGLWNGIVLTGNLAGSGTYDVSILIENAYLDPGETGNYSVKGSIRILPETHIKRGSSLRLTVLPKETS